MSGNAGDFSGDIPQSYDRGLGPIIFAEYAMDIARRARAGGAPSCVLETAAGSGIVTRALRDVLPTAAHLVATDLNQAMLDLARRKFRTDEHVEFQTADATALPFPDASFDTMVCQFGVMFYPDKAKGYREAYRVLVPGGRYLFNVWDGMRHNPFARIAQEIIAGCFADDPPRFLETPFGYDRIDPIKQALQEAGFGAIRISVEKRRQPVEDVSLFAAGLVFGSPLFDQIRQRGGKPTEIQEAVATAMRQEFGGESGIVPMQAIVFEAQKDREP